MRSSATGPSPPLVFRLAGHPLRWRLLRELGWSDRRVRDLAHELGAAQPLLSYHLGRLRAAELVSARRSSFDGRDTYYSLDLARCGELLADAGASLHPALDPAPLGDPSRTPVPGTRVLFLCTGNSARSQIAEALLESLSGGAVEARSAGSRPKPLHAHAVKVMRARGIDISDRQSKHLETVAHERFDEVVSLCDRVREVCPTFPGTPRAIHWSIPDPAAGPGSDADTYPAFERTAVELEQRIRFLLRRLSQSEEVLPS